MERRFVNAPVKLESRGEGQSPLINGYGAVFYDGTPGTEYELWEDVSERIMPGAFDKCLSNDVRGLFNHDPNQILGRTASKTMRLNVDSKGLRYEIDADDTTCSRDVQRYLKRGDVDGSSFSFVVEDEAWITQDKKQIREIRSVGILYDVGPVTFPAYTGTSAASRSAGDVADARKSFEARQAKEKQSLAATLTAIATRARLIEIEAA